jgi:hypothetical protein
MIRLSFFSTLLKKSSFLISGMEQFAAQRAGSGKKDRRLSENSALLDAAIMRPTRRADYETTQTESRSSLQSQGGDSSLARR